MAEESKKELEGSDKNENSDQSSSKRLSSAVPAILITIGVILLLGAGLCIGRGLAFRTSNRRVSGYQSAVGRPMMRGGRGSGKMMRGSGQYNRGLFNGKVTKIDGDILTATVNSKDIQIKISDTTSIYKSTDIAKKTDIAVGNDISVRGFAGSDGIILAQLITIK